MAAELIREAISVGAPAYNAGDIELCAEIYLDTASQLLESCLLELLPSVAAQLQAACQRGAFPAKEQAWAFRRAFDAQLAERVESVAAVIQEAISRGAPAYNSGDIAGCLEIYRATAQALLQRSDMDTTQRGLLSAALQQSAGGDANSGAWTMRRGLDAVAAMAGRSAGAMMLQGSGSESAPTLLHDFSKGTGLDLRVKVVNDTVMGGRSSSAAAPFDGGLRFSGDATKRGGGGFASVRFEVLDAPKLQAALARAEGVLVKVRLTEGCRGWKFQFHQGYDNVTWQADFSPAKEGSEHRIPLARFFPSWRGQRRGERGLTPGAAQSVTAFGFMLSFLSEDGQSNAAFQEGPFALDVLRLELF